MTCPGCGQDIPLASSRCPECGAVAALPVEGALAPDPLADPSLRARGEGLPAVPALRSRSKPRAWQDEVRDRVRSRRRKRTGSGELPLFDEGEPSAAETAAAPEAAPEPPRPVAPAPAPRFVETREPSHPRFQGAPAGFESRVLDRVDPLDSLADLPLQTEVEKATGDPRAPAPTARPAVAIEPMADVAGEFTAPRPTEVEPESPLEGDLEEGVGLDAEPEPPARAAEVLRPVERPAHALERAQAAGVDALLLGVLSAVIVYFTGRVAHVPAEGLRPAGPYLAAFLAFLGLAYAAYFTGTTGQTLGKMVFGLRVVNRTGGPPGYPSAIARAALGTLGVMAAGLGLLPVLFDPARRAFHDRVLHTRVVKG